MPLSRPSPLHLAFIFITTDMDAFVVGPAPHLLLDVPLDPNLQLDHLQCFNLNRAPSHTTIRRHSILSRHSFSQPINNRNHHNNNYWRPSLSLNPKLKLARPHPLPESAKLQEQRPSRDYQQCLRLDSEIQARLDKRERKPLKRLPKYKHQRRAGRIPRGLHQRSSG